MIWSMYREDGKSIEDSSYIEKMVQLHTEWSMTESLDRIDMMVNL